MDVVDKTFSDIVNVIKSWIPRRSEPANVSRDFWMPDQSCRVCYDCDSQFTLFNRRHHCRLCGRIFCNKCTANSIPAPVTSQINPWDEWEKIRVCNFCYKQWEQGVVAFNNNTQVNIYYGQAEFEGISNTDGSQKVHPDADNGNANLTSENGFDTQGLERNTAVGKSEDEPYIYENEAPSSLYVSEDVDAEPVDFENNGLLWLPPEPEDAEDERETFFVDEDDEDNDGNGNAIGEWGYLRNSNSFGSGEHRHKDRTSEEQKKVMKNVVDGHFRALVAQLLQVENLPVEDNGENVWMEIITSLSWEAATLLKPDTSKSGGMDPAEKSVSRYAQEYLLAKDISLVLNVKRPLLERIARCTGTQIVPSIDHLSSPKLGYCEAFHVEKFVENLSSAAAQAYHLALETSFLADEGVFFPEIPLNSLPLPNTTSTIQRSISTVPDFVAPSSEKSQGLESETGPQRTKSVSSTESYLPNDDPCESLQSASCISHTTAFYSSIVASGNAIPGSYNEKILPSKYTNDSTQPLKEETPEVNNSLGIMNDPTVNGYGPAEKLDHGILADTMQNDLKQISTNRSTVLELSSEDVQSHPEKAGITNEEKVPEEEAFPPSPSDHQSILVSLSSRCVWKGTMCERSQLFRIKYYGSFDKPLGRFLRDHLFDQSFRCHSCEMPSEAHVYCYTHQQGTLTISVKKLPEILLPGEREGKIWMWHRCLRCPRINGFPSATQRIVMSDAAWGLSFGKFLELSFSNHAAASRVASCGHSLHRDCLRFYGFGNMVACFRYASIDVHSVYLPPHKLDFDYGSQDWIQKESDEMVKRAEVLFSEVLNGLSKIGEKRSRAELEGMLQREKLEFEEMLHKVLNQEKRKGQPEIDILEIYRLRRQLLFQSYMWDSRLITGVNLFKSSDETGLSSTSSEDKEIHDENQISVTTTAGSRFKSVDSIDGDPKKLKRSPSVGGVGGGYVKDSQSVAFHRDIDMPKNTNHKKEDQPNLPISKSIYDPSEPLEPELRVRRAMSEGPMSLMSSLSDTLDAKWTGGDHSSAQPDSFLAEATTTSMLKEASSVGDHAEDQNANKSIFSSKGQDNMEDSSSWLAMPFLNFYRQFNKNLFSSTTKFDTLVDSNPVYVSSFWNLELLGGARLLLPIGVNDTVIPIYDDEPSSVIAYALTSPEYHSQLNDDVERPKDASDLGSSYFSESTTLQSYSSTDEIAFDLQKSFGSVEEMLLSMPSRNSLMLDPTLYSKTMHAKVSFGEDGPLGKVRYLVTCYYAKRFEALRRVCCPSEFDYIRSLSRCKKWKAQGGKSNVFFAKTLDDRFVIKQVTKTELESFIKFGPGYFKYLSESIGSGSPTCLAKILGIYQITSKHLKGGKESKMDVLVMENLLFRRTVTRLYDLKGSSRSRYNPDPNGRNKVLLDQNLIEAMPTSPIFVGNKAKRLLERAVWNDTGFLASVDVMDYSLLVGVDEEKHELVLGIIDFMRQYTWDKHLETWVKASGILGGPKNASPTIISPKQYKKRFRKAMTTYFLMLPDQWSPPAIVGSSSQSDLGEDYTQGRSSVE
ncbi:hypothetical protein AHAS_Ahas12G0043700 [Arachis hypogaea]